MMRQAYRQAAVPPGPDLRANQKQRTRQALVAAATQLVRAGGQPTVAEVAQAAQVSRATAYRYFPTPEALMLEVAQVSPAAEPVERWVQSQGGGEPQERLRGLVATFHRLALEEEVALRTALRTYLDTWLESRRAGETPPALREGRRIRWLDQTLEPVRQQLTPARWRRLRAALSLTVGVEAVVVLKDVCHASDAEALATLEWAAQALLRAALEEAGGDGGAGKRKRAAG